MTTIDAPIARLHPPGVQMKKLLSTGLTAVLFASAAASFAQNTPKENTMPPMGAAQKEGMGMKMGMGMGLDAKAMDTNSDGMISKDEFMKHHEAMFEKMKKGSNGMVSLKDWEAMHPAMK
jgi:hypothetical protein